MGTLGISLLFVGITLVMNGVNRYYKLDAKSNAFINVITGFIIVALNLVMFTKAEGFLDFQNVASGFLFGITYIFIAANYLLNLDLRPFGWYSLCVAIWAFIMFIISLIAGDYMFAYLWGAWCILWLDGFLELVLKINLSKFFPILSIAEGIFAAFIPAIMMLTNNW